ncbi:hypothetical protein FF52_02770 [Flavobacterium sp. F52]|nr:hypothetical protein FF52_02770 [Flavobacterium sp. F52]
MFFILKLNKKSFVKVLNQKLRNFNINKLTIIIVISTKEKSPQVTPYRKANLCRASNEDFSFVEMTKMRKFMIYFL